ncbi:TetR/AcrR family transcriptional regulator [Pokkaliibacter sp. CJK22405]|uniref:TetR/AcrR family transcriptional regulator n=1 Tax=Pokkaliibacter sp. CJK22405 TaxID=3384615 RepID=UPI003984BB47
MTDSSPTATRQRSRSEEKHQRILEVAIDQFCSQGFLATSMDTIARDADVSKQTVYSHFGSKDELYVKAIEAKCEASSLFHLELDPKAPMAETLMGFARIFTVLVLSDDAVQVMRTCINSAEHQPDLSARFYQVGPAQIYTKICDYLTRLHQAERLCIPRPEMAATHLMSMLTGREKLLRQLGLSKGPLPEDFDIYLQETIAMFLRAYAPE